MNCVKDLYGWKLEMALNFYWKSLKLNFENNLFEG
jgi:hypothetical protein